MRSRTALVLWEDLKENLKRPLFIVWVLVLILLSWGLSTGHVRISSGDTSVGGMKAWTTSEFSSALFFTLVPMLLPVFFLAILAGLAILRDDEMKVSTVLHATPLSVREYVWGKYGAAVLTGIAALVINVLALMLCNHLLPNGQADEIRGPFSALNYFRPALLIGVPFTIWATGIALFVGTVSKRPVLVFLGPVVGLLVCGFFLWNWAPTWLDPRIDQVLQVLDPGAHRWINQTYMRVDRSVEYYNQHAVGYDAVFWLNRLLCLAFGLLAVVWTERHLTKTVRGAFAVRSADLSSVAAAAPATGQVAVDRPVGAIGMTARAPGLLQGIVSVARSESKELWSTPGIYLFSIIILLQILGSTLVDVGAFETPLLITAGAVAGRAMNTITILGTLLLLFYTVESLRREENCGTQAIYGSTPVGTAAILFGKSIANSGVALGIVVASTLGAILAILIQNRTPVQLTPFVVLWGVLMLPTMLLWTSFVGAVYAFTRNRYTTYAIGLGVLLGTYALQLLGKLTWTSNWNLWSSVLWSDFGALELDRTPLVLNRLFALALAVFFIAVTVRFYPRRDPDPIRILHQLAPSAMWRGFWRLSPYLVAPLVLGIVLFAGVRRGYQGKSVEKKSKDYWVQNLATWREAKYPGISDVDLDLRLEPAKHAFSIQGRYRLTNPNQVSLEKFGITGGYNWSDVTWTMNGEPYTPEDRTRLYVFQPKRPLAPGDTVDVGFSYHGRWPAGFSRNGGRLNEFIAPSGAVLTSFSTAVFPLVGYDEGRGVTHKNRFEPRVFPSDWYKESLPPAFGSGTGAKTRIRISGPKEYQYNSVGVCTSDSTVGEDRRVVWESDAPVRLFNVVAGKWEVHRGEGTAIYSAKQHPYNIEEMGRALDAARKYYSEWFRTYPWKELKLSEFAAHDYYAQGFPTDITFSEGIGFLTKDDPKARASFMVTSHEAAHQWWGNLLTPGQGPGGDLLSEGMAHFSTALLLGQMKGEQGRMEFLKRIEERYGNERQADSERPIILINGSKAGDTTVTYDKGGWVFYMTHDLMGRAANFAGIQEFMRRYGNGPDFPLVEDYVHCLREFAPDTTAFDAFAKQWYFEVHVPEYQFTSSKRTKLDDGRWEVRLSLKNRGTGRMPVEVALTRGERFPEAKASAEAAAGAGAKAAADSSSAPTYQEVRTSATLDAGESTDLVLTSDFEPELALVDPDVRVLQLNRKLALVRF